MSTYHHLLVDGDGNFGTFQAKFVRFENTLKGLLAGGITASVKVSILYPTEYASILIQLDEVTGKAARYSGMLDVMRQTVHQNGLIGLYRGLNIRLSGAIPGIALRFGAHEDLKRAFGDEHGHLPNAGARLVCGFGAGAIEAIFVTTPVKSIEIKTIAESAACPASKFCGGGLATSIGHTVRQNGIRSLYQGLFPTVFRQGTAQAVRFSVMDSLKHWHQDGDPTKAVSKVAIGGFGAAAGILSMYASTPFDVVRTRMQMPGVKYRSSWDCTMQIVRKEGFRHLYVDVKIPRLAMACADAAITFVMYETFMEIFHEHWEF